MSLFSVKHGDAKREGYVAVEQAREQLTRTPKPLPTMHLNPDVTDLFAFRFGDFRLDGYEADPTIRAPIAV